MESRIVAEYARAADDYDDRWASYVRSTTRETLARLRLGGSDRLLDVGCGTGELLARVAGEHPGARLAGLDPVPEMLEVARRKLSPQVDLRQGWAGALPWPDGGFDAVVSCSMFHFIPNPLDALREMRRVLAPGGRLVITDWCHDYVACRLCDFYLRLTRRAHRRPYRRDELGRLLREAGHADARIERYRISPLWGLMTAIARKPG